VIIGAHVIVYSKDAEADRAFLRDICGFSHVDAGQSWLIFALPPAEAAVHPSNENDRHELYLMTDDVAAEVARLAARGVSCAPVSEQRWGFLTSIALPGGGKLGLYQPRHAMAISA
jgi:catechol 2,3-dioxygenase-like lactoylglutathione lyase family enzyme